MTDQPSDAELTHLLREKLEKELIPKLKSQKLRMRTVVAVNVLALVDRQIGRGEGPLPEEWDRLRELVKDQEPAFKLVTDLQAAIANYEEELKAKLREGQVDETGMRQTASRMISAALMSKLKNLRAADKAEEEEEAAANAAAGGAAPDPAKADSK